MRRCTPRPQPQRARPECTWCILRYCSMLWPKGHPMQAASWGDAQVRSATLRTVQQRARHKRIHVHPNQAVIPRRTIPNYSRRRANLPPPTIPITTPAFGCFLFRLQRQFLRFDDKFQYGTINRGFVYSFHKWVLARYSYSKHSFQSYLF